MSVMSEMIAIKTGETTLSSQELGLRTEVEVVIGELDGSFGSAFATLFGQDVDGQTCFLASLKEDVQVRPATLVVNKSGNTDEGYLRVWNEVVQPAVAHGVVDAVRNGDVPKKKANDVGIIVMLWAAAEIVDVPGAEHYKLFDLHREATCKAIHKAMNNEPSIDWLLEKQDDIAQHFYPLDKDAEFE